MSHEISITYHGLDWITQGETDSIRCPDCGSSCIGHTASECRRRVHTVTMRCDRCFCTFTLSRKEDDTVEEDSGGQDNVDA